MITECPDRVFYDSCVELGPCWDGSERNEDDVCSCPSYEAPKCHVMDCGEGSIMDDDTCTCHAVVEEVVEEECVHNWDEHLYQFPCEPTYANPITSFT